MALTVTQLTAFAAVARERSVQRAADTLGVTQPSVSAAVSGLTRAVGVTLVERDGRGIKLTVAGEAFAPFADHALGALEQGRRAAAEAAAPGSARVRVIAVNTAGEYLLPGMIQSYRAVDPTTEVLLEIGNRRDVIRELGARRADLGIGGRPIGADLVGDPFVSNELIVVSQTPVRDLSAATWLMREEGSGTRATLEAYLDEQGIQPRERLTLGSNGAVKQGLAIGLGVTLISSHAVTRELRERSLVRVLAPGTPLHRPFHLLYPASPAPRPAVARLIEHLRSGAATGAGTEIESGL